MEMMESEIFEDWHLPNLQLPQPNLALPHSLPDFFCDLANFEDAMDESLARLSLFNVSAMKERQSKAQKYLNPHLALYRV